MNMSRGYSQPIHGIYRIFMLSHFSEEIKQTIKILALKFLGYSYGI